MLTLVSLCHYWRQAGGKKREGGGGMHVQLQVSLIGIAAILQVPFGSYGQTLQVNAQQASANSLLTRRSQDTS